MEEKSPAEDIQVLLTQGKSQEEVYKILLEQGWKIEAIQGSLNRTKAAKELVEEKEDLQKRTTKLIVTIGAILVGVGFFSFIAANWQEMVKPVKVTIIVGAMAASYTAGWFLKERYQYPKTGDALILLGAIIYGAGIFLVGQMFNVRANWPDGLILWMLGVIVLAFALDLFPFFSFAALLGIAVVASYPPVIFQTFGYDPYLLTSAFLLLVGTIMVFFTGRSIRKKMPPQFKELY